VILDACGAWSTAATTRRGSRSSGRHAAPAALRGPSWATWLRSSARATRGGVGARPHPWATPRRPTEENAPPHQDCSGRNRGGPHWHRREPPRAQVALRDAGHRFRHPDPNGGRGAPRSSAAALYRARSRRRPAPPSSSSRVSTPWSSSTEEARRPSAGRPGWGRAAGDRPGHASAYVDPTCSSRGGGPGRRHPGAGRGRRGSPPRASRRADSTRCATDLRVGLGDEAMAAVGETRLEREVVLDDAVVDHHDAPRAVWWGWAFSSWRPWWRHRVWPTPHSPAAARRRGRGQVAQLARGAPPVQACRPGRPRSPPSRSRVLQAPQAVQDHRDRVPAAHVPDDAAHPRRRD